MSRSESRSAWFRMLSLAGGIMLLVVVILLTNEVVAIRGWSEADTEIIKIALLVTNAAFIAWTLRLAYENLTAFLEQDVREMDSMIASVSVLVSFGGASFSTPEAIQVQQLVVGVASVLLLLSVVRHAGGFEKLEQRIKELRT